MHTIHEQMLVLVNEQDEPVGLMEKMAVHRKALLHRAFSVFLFNSAGQMLLQRRALEKYHSGGLWTNTCCSHPYPDESPVQAATRRMKEELGFETVVEPAFHFIYKAALDNELTEHEFDHILVGVFNGEINFNPTEVKNFKWITLDELASDLRQNNQNYTAWFKIIFENFQKSLS